MLHSNIRPPSQNEPVVLIPGFMADARSFMPQIVALGASRPVIVVSPSMSDTVEHVAADVAATLPERFSLVGHGLGGNIAIELLRKRPEAVSRIALIATDPLPEPPQQAAAEEELLVAAKTGRMAECIARLSPVAPCEAPWRNEAIALLQDMARDLGLEQFQRQLRAMQRRPDQQKTLRKANVPTLILAGDKDTVVPRRRSEFMARMMPQGCLEIIANAGHLPQLEQPEAVTKALGTFLSGRLPTLLLT